MKLISTLILIFDFFSLFCFGQRAPKKDRVVSYSTCNNSKNNKVTLLYYKGEVSFVSQYDSLSNRERWVKNP